MAWVARRACNRRSRKKEQISSRFQLHASRVLAVGLRATSLPNPFPAFPPEGSQGPRVPRIWPLPASRCLWFQPPGQFLILKVPSPWLRPFSLECSPAPNADSLKRPRTTPLKLTGDIQVPLRERLSTPKCGANTSGQACSQRPTPGADAGLPAFPGPRTGASARGAAAPPQRRQRAPAVRLAAPGPVGRRPGPAPAPTWSQCGLMDNGNGLRQ